MNTKRILIGILLLAGLTFSGCVWVGSHGYGSRGYSHGDGYTSHGHERPYGNYRDRDDRHDGSGRGSRHW